MAGYVILTYKFHKENKKWVAYCEELGTSTFGRSLTEAKERIRDAVLCHLNALEDVGERERFFKEHGIEFYQTKPKSDINICIPADEEIFVQPHIQRIPVGTPCYAH